MIGAAASLRRKQVHVKKAVRGATPHQRSVWELFSPLSPSCRARSRTGPLPNCDLRPPCRYRHDVCGLNPVWQQQEDLLVWFPLRVPQLSRVGVATPPWSCCPPSAAGIFHLWICSKRGSSPFSTPTQTINVFFHRAARRISGLSGFGVCLSRRG